MKTAVCRTARLRLAWCQASACRNQGPGIRIFTTVRPSTVATSDRQQEKQRHTDVETRPRDYEAGDRAREDRDSLTPPFIDGAFQPYVLTQQEIILSRARAYGIRTIDELQSETELDSCESQPAKLVDRKLLRNDLKLWRILLDHALLHSGPKGAWTIFNGLSKRGPAVKLIEDEFETTYIWQKLLEVAVEMPQDRFLGDLCSKDGIAWDRPNLWAEVVGALVRAHGPNAAARAAHTLAAKHRGLEDLLALYDTLRPRTADQLQSFLHICSRFPANGMYHSMMSKLWQDDLPDLAFSMHEFLLSRNDLPRSYEDIEPFVIYLARTSTELESFLRPLEVAGVGFSAQAHDSYQKEIAEAAIDPTQRPGSTLSSRSKKHRRHMDDNTVARAFATTAFSFDFVLSALPVLGVVEIGPQALREIGLSSSDLQQFSGRIRQLHHHGVDTGGSAFSRFIRYYLIQGNHDLVDAAVKSDMHIDVFEDTALQLELLSRYCAEPHWPKVNLILAMLMVGQNRDAARRRSRDLMLFARIQALSHRDILKELSRQDTSYLSSVSSIPSFLSWNTLSLLVSRLQQATEDSNTADRIVEKHTFLFGLLQELAILGQPIPILLWRRSLLTTARRSSFDETAAMIQWVAWYCHEPKDMAHTSQHSTQLYRPADLSKIFDVRFQTALLLYCVQRSFSLYKRRGKRGQRKLFLRQNLDWRKCLILLKQLEQRCNMRVHVNYLCQAVRWISAKDPGTMPAKRYRKMTPGQLILEKFTLIGAHAALAGIQELWPQADVHAQSFLYSPLSTFESRRKWNILIAPKFLSRTQKSSKLGPNGYRPRAQLLKFWHSSIRQPLKSTNDKSETSNILRPLQPSSDLTDLNSMPSYEKLKKPPSFAHRSISRL